LKFFATLLVLALVAAALVAFAIYAPVSPPAGTSPDNATYVDIAPGTGTQAIATQLEHAGVLRTRFAFDLLRLAKGGRLLAGEYRFDHPAPATEVYARIVRGDVYTIPLTIPEGYNIFERMPVSPRATRSSPPNAAKPTLSSATSHPTPPRSKASSSLTPIASPATSRRLRFSPRW
jgi:cell division protein YceG involved in septum cleavage